MIGQALGSSIRLRLALVTTCTVAAGGLLLGGGSYAWLASDLSAKLDAFALHEAAEVGHVVASAETEEEVIARKRIFTGLFPEEGVLSLEVWSLDGRLVFRLPEAEAHSPKAWPEGFAAARGGGLTPLISVLGRDSYPARRSVRQVSYGGDPRWLASATVSRRSADETLTHFLWTRSLALLVTLLVVYLGSLVLVRRALRPMQEVARDAASIARQGPHERLAVPPPTSELHELVGLINDMLDRNDKTVARLRRFTSFAGHELRTPLSRIRSEAEFALQGDDPGVKHECLASVLEETEELRRVVDALLQLARGEGADLKDEGVIRLDTLLVELIEQAIVVGTERGVQVEGGPAGELAVRGNRALLGRALWNLLDNAVKFAPPAGLVSVRVLAIENDLEIEIRNEGPGLPAGQDPEDFFEPFTTGEVTGRGHGLGLPLSRSIARRHGGDVVARPADAGACFVLRLPLSAPQTDREPMRSRA